LLPSIAPDEEEDVEKEDDIEVGAMTLLEALCCAAIIAAEVLALTRVAG
jgi:hypothetical protein